MPGVFAPTVAARIELILIAEVFSVTADGLIADVLIDSTYLLEWCHPRRRRLLDSGDHREVLAWLKKIDLLR
jgi:hypothetical protein